MSLKLIGANVCPFVHRARLVLAEKALDHEYVSIDLRNKPDWYHDVLPTGRVPLIEHNGAKIWESDIICEYLEDAFPDSQSLVPKSAVDKAKMRLKIGWAGSEFVPVFYKLLSAQDEKSRDEHKAALEEVLKDLEKQLGETQSPYFLEELSLADLELYPWFERWCVLEHYRDFSLPEDYPNLSHWREALSSRESVKSIAEPDSFFIEQYVEYATGTKVPK